MQKLIHTTYHSSKTRKEQKERYYTIKAKLAPYKSNTIIAFVRWSNNGVSHAGYKIIEDLDSCFARFNTLQAEWYIDDINFISTQVHEGGINYLTFRELKDNKNQKLITKKVLDGTLTRADITKYTRSLKPIIEDLLYNSNEMEDKKIVNEKH